MKKSYLLPLTISASAIFCNATAFAQSWTQCRAFEFAEMQTMNKTELEELYCKNKRTMEAGRKSQTSSMDAAIKMAELGRQYAQIGDRRGLADTLSKSDGYRNEAGKYGEHADACSAENERVLRVIRKGNNKDAPKCE